MGKQLSIRRRNALPMLLLTFLLKGGLNQIMFLDRLRLRDGVVCGGGLNSRLWVYPLFFSASWYGGAASWKSCSSEDISDSLLFTDSGIFFYHARRMVQFAVYVQGRVRWLRVRFKFTTIQVKSNVEKIDNFFVRFDCDFKFVLGENFANFFLNSFCLLGGLIQYCKSVIPVEADVEARYFLQL